MNVDVKPAAGMAPMVTEPPEINTVGVIGAGQMGNGIAHVCALAGLPVTIVDIKPDALTKAMALMARNMDRQVNRSIITSDQRDEALARVKTSTDYAAFADADLVIEAATEKEDLKRQIFKSLIPQSEAVVPGGVQHVFDLDYPAGGGDRPAGKVHRHALHEPGSGHEARRDHPWHRHR